MKKAIALCINTRRRIRCCWKIVVAAGLSSTLVAGLMHEARATHLPQPSKYDARIQYVHYHEDDVVTVYAYPGLGTQIVFSPGEETLDIACGFSQGWEIAEKRNVLYLKPKSIKVSDERVLLPEAGKWNTNLLVTTNKHFYAFDLHLMPDSIQIKKTPLHSARSVQNATKAVSQKSAVPSSSLAQKHLVHRPSYRIQFLYPSEPAGTAKEARNIKTNAQNNTQTIPSKLSTVRNWQYSMQVGKNAQSIAPTIVYDDGRFTYLQFPNNQDFPAVFLLGEDGSEHLVNTHVDAFIPGEAEDLLVIHRVAPRMVLRSGSAIVHIYNDLFHPHGVPPHDGTTVQGLQRVLRTTVPESVQGEVL
jgi:P-type conjugative transfer protein VirB9